jgi:hypothetical protein
MHGAYGIHTFKGDPTKAASPLPAPLPRLSCKDEAVPNLGISIIRKNTKHNINQSVFTAAYVFVCVLHFNLQLWVF